MKIMSKKKMLSQSFYPEKCKQFLEQIAKVYIGIVLLVVFPSLLKVSIKLGLCHFDELLKNCLIAFVVLSIKKNKEEMSKL